MINETKKNRLYINQIIDLSIQFCNYRYVYRSHLHKYSIFNLSYLQIRNFLNNEFIFICFKLFLVYANFV